MRFGNLFLVAMMAVAMGVAIAPRVSADPSDSTTTEADDEAGGYFTPSADTPGYADAQTAALAALRARFPNAGPVLTIEAQAQLVSGMNYAFTITTGAPQSPGRYLIAAYKPLDGPTQIRSVTKVG